MRSIPRPLEMSPLVVLLLATANPLFAQGGGDSLLDTERFVRPPAAIADAVLAPRHRNVTLGNPSPDGTRFLTVRRAGPPSMADLAQPFYRLGGWQVDWRANRARTLNTRGGIAVEVTDRASAAVTRLDGPEGARVSGAVWSPDGSQVAWLVHEAAATHVYVGDAATGRTRRVTRAPVLATLVTQPAWTPDGRAVVTVLLPENRGPAPEPPAVPLGPQVRRTTPETNRVRTYPDLLQGPHERALVEYYATGQLAVIDVARRRTRRIGTPAMIQAFDVAPDGQHALVRTMQKPFSYIVPVRQFARRDEVWSLADGTVLARLDDQPVQTGAPADTARGDGPPPRRNLKWHPAGGLVFLQSAAPDTGENDAEADGPSRAPDRVMRWTAPFDSAASTVLYESTRKLDDVRFSATGDVLVLTERRGETTHDYAVRLDAPETTHTLWRGSRRRRHSVATTSGPGGEIVRTTPDLSGVFVIGSLFADDPATEGPRTFVDRVDLGSGETTRVFESEHDGVYERVLAVLNDEATQLLVSRESPQAVPNSYFHDTATGDRRVLTDNVDYTPDLTQAQRRRYTITRVDGLEFAAEVTLPADWSGERLPGIVWFYPREYTSQDQYDERVRDVYNKNAFPNLRARSMDVLVHLGYAVIEPDAPIVGDEGRMNDNYVHDLRNNLAATLDRLDAEGIIDRQRMGVGGHSYGAFSTVNAMVHTPFFKAGIAGDGNYNRTLTPFAFQSERRMFWQARDLYFGMSPIFYANNLSGALLMYHGADDQNVGTFPIHSWRMFETLESLGKTAAMYMYPYEEHGPASEETLLDLWARWTAWLDLHVKRGGTAARSTADEPAA